MRAAAVENLEGRGFSREEVQVEYVLAMRFAGQTFDVDVPVDARPLTDDDREALIASFQERYGELYGAGSVWENFPMTVMTARVVARGVRPKPSPPRVNGSADGASADTALRKRRRVYLSDAGGWTGVDCYEAAGLPVGEAMRGPCIVEDVDTTIFVPADARLTREPFGGFELQLSTTTEGAER